MPRNNNALIVLLVTRPFERPALFPLPLAGGGTARNPANVIFMEVYHQASS